MRQRPYLLDTNILLHVIRDSTTGRRINEAYKLTASLDSALISIVTVGELWSFARKWGSEKKQALEAILSELVWIDINRHEILMSYGEIKEGSKGYGIGDNDIWIAATARVTNAILLTTDKDFDPLHDQFIQRIWIDPTVESA